MQWEWSARLIAKICKLSDGSQFSIQYEKHQYLFISLQKPTDSQPTKFSLDYNQITSGKMRQINSIILSKFDNNPNNPQFLTITENIDAITKNILYPWYIKGALLGLAAGAAYVGYQQYNNPEYISTMMSAAQKHAESNSYTKGIVSTLKNYWRDSKLSV